ncbi:uncharacterized protein LOC120140793 isoform X2 [Hibiscus syriacus]|uniref:uncharacterized protein LOC120140793 isoform X2 n=1 Tax=Hibiscus syriacus TaxID=106335 RepID=UPI001922A37A|nr:uncharacterized protein LOC120140793 isoform X2 [Hibiscus syriacus]
MEELSELHDHRGSSFLLPNLGPDAVNTPRKAGKMPSSSSGFSKRTRVGQIEDIMISTGVDDVKDRKDKPGCNSTKYKTQTPRQKNSFSGKRGDRKIFKVPMKPKSDSFSKKGGFASFTMASGGNNFLGLYGQKSDDINDVTELVEDLSLNELLDGIYEHPILGSEKGRKATNTTENFLHSVKKVFSILPIRRVQSHNVADIGSSSHMKMPSCPLSSVSISASSVKCDKEDTCSVDPSPCNKDSSCKSEMPASPPDFSLCQPKDILQRLALPPPKDLDSLLLDATKPSTSTRNNSSGKQILRQASLPSFPWSHTLNGCKANPDAVKLLANKSMCQGRWVKVPNASSSPETATGCFTNLESLAYDPSLIPSFPKFGNSEGEIASPSGTLRLCEQHAASLATYSKAFNVPQVGHCPIILTAARTLCDIATKPLRQNPDGIIRWPKKPSQKAMKGRKTKSIEKSDEVYATTSLLGSDKLLRCDTDQIILSKRPKLSVVENKKDLNHINGVKKAQMAWSAPKSSRSSPGKTVSDIRHSTANVVKLPCTNLPSTVLDKPCNGQHKLRKLMSVDWKRGRDRLD